MKPPLGQPPPSLDGDRRDPDDLRRLLDAQTPEEAQLDDPTQLPINDGQIRQRVVEGDEVGVTVHRRLHDIRQSKLATVAATPDRMAPTRMVDEKMPHGSGGHGKELRAVGPFDRRRSADEPEVHFVYERRRLERLIARLTPKTLIRQATQLVIHQGQQPRGSLAVAPARPETTCGTSPETVMA